MSHVTGLCILVAQMKPASALTSILPSLSSSVAGTIATYTAHDQNFHPFFSFCPGWLLHDGATSQGQKGSSCIANRGNMSLSDRLPPDWLLRAWSERAFIGSFLRLEHRGHVHLMQKWRFKADYG